MKNFDLNFNTQNNNVNSIVISENIKNIKNAFKNNSFILNLTRKKQNLKNKKKDLLQNQQKGLNIKNFKSSIKQKIINLKLQNHKKKLLLQPKIINNSLKMQELNNNKNMAQILITTSN